VPHVASVSFLYDIPSASENRFVKGITSGFTLSGIWRIQSGAPETAYLNGLDINRDGVKPLVIPFTKRFSEAEGMS